MEASTSAASRLIGAIFVEKGLITQEQLEAALETQAETGERLGEVLIRQFGVARLELASVLAEQWAGFERDSKARTDAEPEGTTPAPIESNAPEEPQLRRPIGEIFLERGFVSPEALDRALEVQHKTGQRLGEVLVNEGSISRLDLASALAEQWSAFQQLRPPAPVEPIPWQNGAPATAPAPASVPAEGAESPASVVLAVERLEERIRLVEHAAAAAPWNRDLQALADEIRAAITRLEQRVADAPALSEPTPLDAVETALEELRARIDGPARRVDDLERQLAEGISAEAVAAFETRLADLRARIESVAERTATVTPEAFDQLQATVASLPGAVASKEELGELQVRLDEVASRAVLPEEETGLAELRTEIAALAERGAVEPHDVAELGDRVAALADRVDRLAATDPAIADRLDAVAEQAEVAKTGLASIASKIEELAGLGSRIDDIAVRVENEDAVEDLRGAQAARLAALEERVSDESALESLAATVDEQRRRIDARLDELSSSVADAGAVDALRAQVDDVAARVTAAVQVEAVEGRVAALEGRLGELAPFEEVREEVRRVAESAAGERASLERELLARVEELRARFDDLSARLDTGADSDALDEATAALQVEIARLAERLGRQERTLADLPEAPDPTPRLDQLSATIAAHAASVAADLEAFRGAAAERERSVSETLSGLADRVSVEELRERAGGLEHRLGETRDAVEAVRAEVADRLEEGVEAVRAELDARDRQLEERIEPRIEEHEGRLAAEAQALRAELGSLGVRVDELLGLRHGDVQATLSANEALAARLDELDRLRATDLDEARTIEADLVARLDDLALRAAAAASEAERSLRGEIEGLASTLEEKDAAAVDERELLRGELERIAASVSWRLERIEENLGSGDAERLRATVTELEQRLQAQAQLAEEQVRVTERALRKGLALLGERLAENQTAYLESGNALRRSIERLGAAVVEADERIAEREDEGGRGDRFAHASAFVAFAPIDEGYRMVELGGPVPAVGDTVQVPGSDAPLVVTRVGPSPLPLDTRPCAYFEGP